MRKFLYACRVHRYVLREMRSWVMLYYPGKKAERVMFRSAFDSACASYERIKGRI
jgi:hypothetical protein